MSLQKTPTDTQEKRDPRPSQMPAYHILHLDITLLPKPPVHTCSPCRPSSYALYAGSPHSPTTLEQSLWDPPCYCLKWVWQSPPPPPTTRLHPALLSSPCSSWDFLPWLPTPPFPAFLIISRCFFQHSPAPILLLKGMSFSRPTQLPPCSLSLDDPMPAFGFKHLPRCWLCLTVNSEPAHEKKAFSLFVSVSKIRFSPNPLGRIRLLALPEDLPEIPARM